MAMSSLTTNEGNVHLNPQVVLLNLDNNFQCKACVINKICFSDIANIM